MDSNTGNNNRWDNKRSEGVQTADLYCSANGRHSERAEEGQQQNRDEREDFTGSSKTRKKWEPSVQSPHFLVVTKHFSSLFLRLITGYNISPERFTDIKVSGRANREAMTRWICKQNMHLLCNGEIFNLIDLILIKYLILESLLSGEIVVIKLFSVLSSVSPWQPRCP